MSNPEIPMHAAPNPVKLSPLLPQQSLVNDSVGGMADWRGRVIHQCLGRVSHCHMSVRARAALIASVRHLSPTRGKRRGMGAGDMLENRAGGGATAQLCVNRLID